MRFSRVLPIACALLVVPELNRPASGQVVASDQTPLVKIGKNLWIGSARYEGPSRAAKMEPSHPPFEDEPGARALYDRMIQTIRNADTLYYESDRRLDIESKPGRHVVDECTYKLWAKKPHFARIEAASADGERKGVLVADGAYHWIHWPTGRPVFTTPLELLKGGEREDDRFTSYLQFPAPRRSDPIGDQKRSSIRSRVAFVGMNLLPVLNPSLIHGHPDAGTKTLDRVRSLGTERVGEEECDVIESSHPKLHRIRRLWLSRRDHLPRKLQDTFQPVGITMRSVTDELWSNVRINEEMPPDQFHWQPPEGWTRYYPNLAHRRGPPSSGSH